MKNYAAVRKTSKSAVKRELLKSKTAGIFQGCRFLDAVNAFRSVPEPSRINMKDVAAYLPVSSITHLHDAWRYLGTALRALSHNDIGVCGHAAYYAELRAAMSFLAVNGIVTLRNSGYYLDASGMVSLLYKGGGTHEAVWAILKEFSKLPIGSSDKARIDKLICPGGRSLSDWVNAFSSGIGIANAFYARLLTCWTMDIGKYESDREARNKYSYGPTDLDNYMVFGREKLCAFLSTVWRMFEPDARGSFPSIDYYILLQTLRGLRNNLGLSFVEYKRRLLAMIHQLFPGTPNAMAYVRTIFSKRTLLPYSFDPSSGDATWPAGALHVEMLFRACFMLRAATAACKELLSMAGMAKDFWWWEKDIQENRLMWQASVAGFQYQDVWDDIKLSMESLDSYAPRGAESWLMTEAESLETLTQSEYMMLWGLGL